MKSEGEQYYPCYVSLEITKACNMRCIHCGTSADDRNRENPLLLTEWFKTIDGLKELKTNHISLSGGEPFLYPYWRELVKYIKSKNIKSNFISNGLAISEDDIVFMKNNGVTHVAISVDGNEEIHDKIRRFPGSYKKIMSTIELLNKHDLPVTISTSVNKLNFDIRNEILMDMLNLNIIIWQVQIVNSFGRAGEKKEQIIISKDQYAKLCEDLYEWKKKYVSKLRIVGADSIGYCDGGIIDELLDGDEWMGCNAGIYNLGIESNGSVKGCLSLQDDKFIAGNIRERSIVDIWGDRDAFWYTRQYDPNLMSGSCKGCIKSRQCMAGCLGMAYSIHNTIYENSYCYKSIKGI